MCRNLDLVCLRNPVLPRNPVGPRGPVLGRGCANPSILVVRGGLAELGQGMGEGGGGAEAEAGAAERALEAAWEALTAAVHPGLETPGETAGGPR